MGEPIAKPEVLSFAVLVRGGPPIAVVIRSLAPATRPALTSHPLEKVLAAFRRTTDA